MPHRWPSTIERGLVAHHVVELWRYPSLGFQTPSAESYEESCRSMQEIGHSQLLEFVTTHAHEDIQPNSLWSKGPPRRHSVVCPDQDTHEEAREIATMLYGELRPGPVFAL